MKSLYITSVRTFSGKTALSLGLGLRMQAAGLKVGYLKPMSTQPYEAGGRVLDSDADFVRRTLGLETHPWELSPVIVTTDLLHQVMDGSLKRDLLADVEQAYRQAGENNDVVIVEGGATMREGYAVGLNTLNLVEHLDVPAISVINHVEDCVDGLCLMDDALAAQRRLGDHLLGVVLNEVPREDLQYYR
jgi:BioD-like phosphotransacetylase family protein